MMTWVSLKWQQHEVPDLESTSSSRTYSNGLTIRITVSAHWVSRVPLGTLMLATLRCYFSGLEVRIDSIIFPHVYS
jgi:hypothetical protein